jgi:hypothetical protein
MSPGGSRTGPIKKRNEVNMKKIFVFSAILFLVSGSTVFGMMGDEPERGKVDMPEAAAKLLPDNGDILLSLKADLNGDKNDDFLVAFEYLDARRELIIITKEKKGYKLASRSWRAIMCKECGGVYGDPFVRIWAEKKKFGVDHFGGSNFKWSNNSVFGYSKRDNKWQLIDFQSANYDLENNVEEKKYTPEDFGLINLEDYSLDNLLSGENLGPVPDETEVAISEEKTAVAEQKTAEIVAKFTPTPIPPYVYKKPEQLKNTELISMAGGEFLQSDGTKSFKNTLSPFKIGKYMVTYELWFVVKVWAQKNGYKFYMDGMEKQFGQNELPTKDSTNPVIGISRRDAIVWCNAYSQMMKLKPLYCSDAAFKNPIKSSEFGDYPSSENKTPGSFDNPYVDWSASGYRLPTEGEWLYSASYIDGQKWADPNALSNDSNKSGFVYVSNKYTEWLWDFFADYPTADMKDYRGVEPSATPAGSPNVLHGGYTEKSPIDPNMFTVSIGYRIQKYPLLCDSRNGFRVVRGK